MADLMVICAGCGSKIVASEFADAVTCRSCGKVNPVRTPVSIDTGGGVAAEPSGQKMGGLKLKDAGVHETVIKPPADVEELVKKVKARANSGKKKGSAEWANHPLFAWGVFIVLGGACAAARFGGILPPEYLEMFKTWGPAGALFFHLVLVIKAFEDSVFYGSLSLLIPPYSFYYLFALCDVFILRALYMGVLAGVGFDTYLLLKYYSIETYIKVNSWILGGG